MATFLALFVGLLTAGMPVFLVLGLCAGAMFATSGQPLIGLAQLMVNELNSVHVRTFSMMCLCVIRTSANLN